MTPSPTTSPASPIKFGTSGWRGLIADDFTFANVRLAVTAIAGHVNEQNKNPTILVGYDPRFYSEEFSQLAVDILQHHNIKTHSLRNLHPDSRRRLRNHAPQARRRHQFHRQPQSRPISRSEIFLPPMPAPRCPKSPKTSKRAPPNSPHKATVCAKPISAPPQNAAQIRVGQSSRHLSASASNSSCSFDVLRQGKAKFVIDALHGCGAGYLDGVLDRPRRRPSRHAHQSRLPLRRHRPRRLRRKSRATPQRRSRFRRHCRTWPPTATPIASASSIATARWISAQSHPRTALRLSRRIARLENARGAQRGHHRK